MKFLHIVKQAALAALMVASITVSAQGLETRVDRSASVESLYEAEKATGKTTVSVAYYDTRQGLLAVYEAPSGKRVVFRAYVSPKGKVMAQAFHFDSKTRKVAGLMGPRSRSSPKASLYVGGLDLLETLNEGRKNKRFNAEKQNAFRVFLRTEAGKALLDGIGALYLELPALEASNEVGKLKIPFGLVRTSLELVSGQQDGMQALIKQAGPQRGEAMANACDKGNCLYRGQHFLVQKSGLFDVMSNRVSAQLKTAYCAAKPMPPAASVRTASTPVMLSEGVLSACHGACGLDCFNPGNIYTAECLGHDNCVYQKGHMDCIFGTPDGCVDCNSLIEAIWSYMEALFITEDEALKDRYWDLF